MSSEQSKFVRQRRWWRRGRRIGIGVLCLFGVLALLSGVALWLAYKNPTATLKLVLGRFAPALGLEIEAVEVDAPGRIVLQGVVLNGAAGTAPQRLERVEIGYSGMGFGVLWEGRIDSVAVDGGQLVVDDAFLERWLPASSPGAEEVEATPLPGWLGRVVPGEIGIEGIGVALAMDGLPPVALAVDFHCGGPGGRISGLEVDVPGRHVLRLTRGRVGDGEGKVLRFDVLEVEAQIGVEPGESVVADLRVQGLRCVLTPEVVEMWEAFVGEKPAGGASPDLPPMLLRRAQIDAARVLVSGFDGLPEVAAQIDIDFEALRFAGGKLTSSAMQSVVVRELVADGSGQAARPFVRWDALEVVVVPDALIGEGWVERLHLRGLEVDVSESSLGKVLDTLAGRSDVDEGSAVAGGEGMAFPHIKVRDLQVEPTSLSFDPDGLFDGLPAATATLQVQNEAAAEEGDAAYVLEMNEIEVRERAASENPFGRGGEVAVRFSTSGLLRDGRLDTVELSGFRVEIGEEVQRLSGAFPTAAAADAAAPASAGDGAGPSLSVAKLTVRDTVITLRDLIPEVLPYLPLNIDTSLENVPLLGSIGEGEEREQRVEIKGIQIASPHNSLQNAAELKTVWIYFTIPGLFRSEIRRVEIVSPDIYVGEPLFWYINSVRERGAEEPVADAVAVEAVAVGEGDAIVEGLKSFELSGWRVGRVEAHSGRIFIAPTGVPLGIVPFPFEASTDFDEGEIRLNVDVPTGDYVFEDLELEFKNLSGQAYVNYPVAKKDNNFVQTFKTPVVRFMQFEGAAIWLSVTYDEKGIYGKLGGEAYGGYVNGEFNIYIEGPYRWDAWLTGQGFDLGAFTKVLAPNDFLMSGVIDGHFVAEGVGIGVESANGSVRTRGGGVMQVLKLDELRKALPEEWAPLWKAIAEVGLDALRDYPFDSGTAEFEWEAGEGDARVLLDGSSGKRELELKVFDHRPEGAPSGGLRGMIGAARSERTADGD